MESIRIGDIILSRENSIFSRIVRFITKSNWSHVSIYVGGNQYVSAEPLKGICVKDISFLNEYAVYRIDIDEATAEMAVDVALSYCGKEYDYVQAILLFWRILTDTLTINTDDPNPNKFVCSEFVAEVFNHVGVNFGSVVDNVLPSTIEHSSITYKIA